MAGFAVKNDFTGWRSVNNAGDIIAGETFYTTLPSDFFYNDLRSAKLSALREYENTLRDTGAIWPNPPGNDKRYRVRVDAGDIEKYNSVALKVAFAKIPTDNTFTTFEKSWSALSGTIFSVEAVPVALTLNTVDEGKDFTDKMLTAHQSIAATFFTKQAEILALPNNEATINAYDVTSGWPSI